MSLALGLFSLAMVRWLGGLQGAVNRSGHLIR